MSDKEKLNNPDLEPVEVVDLVEVTGGGDGLNPPAVVFHPDDVDVKSRM